MNIIQFFIEGLRLAQSAIKANRLRTFLTMLGVATGVFVITSILSLSSSLQTSLTKNLSALGNTTLFVHNWPWTDQGDDWFKYFNRPKVSYQDFRKLNQALQHVDAVGYQVNIRGQNVTYKGSQVSGADIVGITQDMEKIFDFEFDLGRSFSGIEYKNGSYVCIIGAEIKDALYPNEEAVGKSLRIGSKRLKVIGVLKKVGVAIGGRDDDGIYVPYLASSRMYNLSKRSVDKVAAIKAINHKLLPQVEDQIIGIMRASRGLRPSAENNFSVNKQESIMNEINQVFGYLDLGGIIMSLFSVLIGGFSIGNIMYISVKERTREIGIQKSMGATKSFILYQFMMEAILICVLGGLIGLIGVYSITEFVQFLLSSNEIPLEVFVSMGFVLFGLGFSVGIGVLAGFIPAWIGASVDPVVAIRQA